MALMQQADCNCATRAYITIPDSSCRRELSGERSINLRQKQLSVYNPRQVSRRPVNARRRGERPETARGASTARPETVGVKNARRGSFCISLSNCLARAHAHGTDPLSSLLTRLWSRRRLTFGPSVAVCSP